MAEHPKADIVAAKYVPPPTSTGAWAPGIMADPAVTFAQAIEEEDNRLSFHQLSLAFRRNRLLVLVVAAATVLGTVAMRVGLVIALHADSESSM